jgi:hypothetical protein
MISKRQTLLMLLWKAFYPSGDSKPTGLYRFHLPLIADFGPNSVKANQVNEK